MASHSPTRLGRYQILDEIGRGAMGVVYLAKDPLIGRLVALKTFRVTAALSGEDLALFRARFIREAQSAGILSHPHIVTIHDVVEESAEGITFIAMEYVRGTDLKQVLLSEGRLELGAAAKILGQVADALEYAHSKGVVHRDVKPANILLTRDRQVKLTDFGIARLNTSNLTLDGQLLGTPNYMAPEQVQGGACDHRVDVFALGVVLYEMLTGAKPFKGANVTMVTHRIVYDDYTPPGEHGPRPAERVEHVIARALAKDPDKRYGRVTEMAEEVHAAAAELAEAERLNDTQVILDPAPALSGGGALNAPGPAAARRLTPRGANRPPLLRLLLVAGVTVVTALLAGGLLIFAAGTQEDAASAPSPEHEARILAQPFLRLAARYVEEGDPVTAAAFMRQAERIAPLLPELRKRRQQLDEQAGSMSESEERQAAVAAAFEAARIAIERARWADALAAAEEVLGQEPDNPEALAFATAARRGLARQAERERQDRQEEANERQAAVKEEAEDPSEEIGAAPPVLGPPPVARPLEPAADATLELSFTSAIPEGVVMIYHGRRQIAREPYRFVRKRGFFRTVGVGGTVENSYTVPSGRAVLRILVAPKGEAAINRTLETLLPPGGTLRLVVMVDEDRSVTARVE